MEEAATGRGDPGLVLAREGHGALRSRAGRARQDEGHHGADRYPGNERRQQGGKSTARRGHRLHLTAPMRAATVDKGSTSASTACARVFVSAVERDVYSA